MKKINLLRLVVRSAIAFMLMLALGLTTNAQNRILTVNQARISDSLAVTGNSTFTGGVSITGDFDITGNTTVTSGEYSMYVDLQGDSISGVPVLGTVYAPYTFSGFLKNHNFSSYLSADSSQMFGMNYGDYSALGYGEIELLTMTIGNPLQHDSAASISVVRKFSNNDTHVSLMSKEDSRFGEIYINRDGPYLYPVTIMHGDGGWHDATMIGLDWDAEYEIYMRGNVDINGGLRVADSLNVTGDYSFSTDGFTDGYDENIFGLGVKGDIKQIAANGGYQLLGNIDAVGLGLDTISILGWANFGAGEYNVAYADSNVFKIEATGAGGVDITGNTTILGDTVNVLGTSDGGGMMIYGQQGFTWIYGADSTQISSPNNKIVGATTITGSTTVTGELTVTDTLEVSSKGILFSDGTTMTTGGGASYWTESNDTITADYHIWTDSTAHLYGDVYTDRWTKSATNVFLGVGVLGDGNATNPVDNVAIGNQAMESITSGDYNVAIGTQVMEDATTSTDNTIIGYQSFIDGTTNDGTAIGYRTLVKGGTESVAIGHSSMRNAQSNNSVAIGALAMYYASGDYNVAIGNRAMIGSASCIGSENVIVGNNAGKGITTGSDNIFIGDSAGYNETTNSDLLFIDNSPTATPLIHGNFATDRLTINDILNLNELADFPTASEGDIIYKNDTVWFYNGANWAYLDFTIP